MEILSASAGAFLGAIVSFILATFSKSREKKKKVLLAIRSELRLNLKLAEDINKANDEDKIKKGGRCVIIPFAEAALQGVMGSGELSQLNRKIIDPLIGAFTMIRRTNYIADKIKFGVYRESVGVEYNRQVKKAKENIKKVLSQLN